MNLQKLLNDYVMDQENPERNWDLAECYYAVGQTASALSFYLRCAERTDDDLLAYTCLCKIALCFEKPGNRTNSVRGIAMRAITVMPKRPEAFFILSRCYEMSGSYCECYTYAEMALANCDFTLPPLRTNVEYPGPYVFLFEKAVAGYYWGREAESRVIFAELNKASTQMPAVYREAVKKNLASLGPVSKARKL